MNSLCSGEKSVFPSGLISYGKFTSSRSSDFDDSRCLVFALLLENEESWVEVFRVSLGAASGVR